MSCPRSYNYWIMMWRLSLKVCGPKKVHMAGIANTIANAINRLDIDPTCNVSEDILKGLDESD